MRTPTRSTTLFSRGRMRVLGAAVIGSLVLSRGLANLGAPAARAGAPGAVATAIPPSVATTIARVTSKASYRHSSWGVAILDAVSRRLLYGLNAGQMFVPGSLMKIYSTATALQAYGPGYRFRTPVYRDGRVSGGVLHGNLDLVASGDFSMGLRERPGRTLAFNNFPVCDHNYADVADSCGLVGGNPLAAVQRLAASVRAAGIRRVSGNVIVDDRLFHSFTGWPDGVISPIWTNENVIDVTTIATAPGRAARLSWRPHVAGYRVSSTVRTVNRGGATSVRIARRHPG